MSSVPKKAQPGRSKELQNPIRSPGMFENIPQIPSVAPPSTAPWVLLSARTTNKD